MNTSIIDGIKLKIGLMIGEAVVSLAILGIIIVGAILVMLILRLFNR